MPRTTRSAARLGVLTAVCATGLLVAGPAAAVDTVPPPELGESCVVGEELPDPFTCDTSTGLVTLMTPPTTAAPAAPAPSVSQPAAKTPVVAPTTAPRRETRPTGGTGTTPAPDRASRDRVAAPPVAPAPRPVAQPGTLLRGAQAPAAPTNLTGQRTAATPISGAPAPAPLAALPPVQALSAVQEPLLAVGDAAAAGGPWQLAAMPGAALPGLLVVLGTAAVAAVGVGNVRAWQLRQLPVRRTSPRRR